MAKYLLLGFSIILFLASFFLSDKLEESTVLVIGWVCFCASIIVFKIDELLNP